MPKQYLTPDQKEYAEYATVRSRGNRENKKFDGSHVRFDGIFLIPTRDVCADKSTPPCRITTGLFDTQRNLFYLKTIDTWESSLIPFFIPSKDSKKFNYLDYVTIYGKTVIIYDSYPAIIVDRIEHKPITVDLVPTLTAALKYTNIRKFSIKTLGDIGAAAESAVPALIELYRTADESLRVEISRSIQKIDSAKCNLLIGHLKRPYEFPVAFPLSPEGEISSGRCAVSANISILDKIQSEEVEKRLDEYNKQRELRKKEEEKSRIYNEKRDAKIKADQNSVCPVIYEYIQNAQYQDPADLVIKARQAGFKNISLKTIDDLNKEMLEKYDLRWSG